MSDETIQEDTGDLDAAQAVEQPEAEQEESATSNEAETEAEESADDQPEEPPKPRGVQKRISELTANWRSAERDRDYWRELAVGKQKQPEPAAQPKSTLTDFPTLESVGFDESEHQKAVGEWAKANIEALLAERQTVEQQKQAQQQLQKNLQDFYARGAKVAADFDAVVSDDALPVTEAMRDSLLNIEKGPEVLYHLAQNPDEMYRIANLSPYAQAAEIGRLEVRLSIPKPSKTTSAPPPVKPLSAGGESVSKNPDDMSTQEWLEWRNKTLKR